MRKKWTSVVIATLSLLLWFAISKGISFYLSPPNSILWRMILGTMVIPYCIALPLSYLVLRLVKPSPGEEKKSLSLRALLEFAVIQSGLSVFFMFLIQLFLMMTGLATAQEISSLKGVGILSFSPSYL